MNKSMQGAAFEPFKNYSLTMVALYMALLYSPGLPVLYIFTMVTFTLNFFVEKYLILNEYTKGQYMDEKINKMVMGLAEFAIFIHLGNAFWVFSNPGFFP
jgi:hypothetical protein